jgi:hypothetical protein
MAAGWKERIQRKSFVGPVREDIHEQAVAHHLLDANLHYLGDASAGDTRAEHGLHIRHKEPPFAGISVTFLPRWNSHSKGLAVTGL